MNVTDLNKNTVAQLRNIASIAGIPHTSKMRKFDLINVILQASSGGISSSTNTCLTESDELAKEIFDTFVKKYQKDMAFERERKKVFDFYRNGQLLESDYIDLLANINGFESNHNNLITEVSNNREYKDKVSGVTHTINTGKDWAEAIIELQDNINKFKAIINDVIKSKNNINYLTSQCDKLAYQKCVRPCIKRTSRFKNICSYKK